MIQINILLKSEKHENTVKNKSNVYLMCYWCDIRLVNPHGITDGRQRIGGNQVDSFVRFTVGWSLFPVMFLENPRLRIFLVFGMPGICLAVDIQLGAVLALGSMNADPNCCHPGTDWPEF